MTEVDKQLIFTWDEVKKKWDEKTHEAVILRDNITVVFRDLLSNRKDMDWVIEPIIDEMKASHVPIENWNILINVDEKLFFYKIDNSEYESLKQHYG